MDIHDVPRLLNEWLDGSSQAFQRLPGSAVLIRYVQSSYQNDPVRSAIELVLVIFFVRYLLSPSYSTDKKNFIKLREDEIDELVDEWIPEPLVAPQTIFEEAESEKVPILTGYVGCLVCLSLVNNAPTIT